MGTMGEKVYLPTFAGFVDEPLSRFVEFYPLRPQFGRAPHARDERGNDDPDDEERGYLDAVGALYYVRNQGVDEHEGDDPEGDRSQPQSAAQGGERHGE